MYEPDRAAPGVAVAVAVEETSYVVLDVNDRAVTAVAKSAAGAVLDTVSLTPGPEQTASP
jgi:hypothetical protein